MHLRLLFALNSGQLSARSAAEPQWSHQLSCSSESHHRLRGVCGLDFGLSFQTSQGGDLGASDESSAHVDLYILYLRVWICLV